MPERLKAKLDRPVPLPTTPPRVMETFLDAVAYLHERITAEASAESEALVDALLAAAASGDAEARRVVTAALERFVGLGRPAAG